MMRINTVEHADGIQATLNSFLKPGTVLTGPENGEKYTIDENSPNEIKVSVTSWDLRGGVHFNCRMIYTPICVVNEEGHYSGGYLGGLDIETDLQIDLERLVTQKDLNNKHEDWDGYSMGSETTRFNDMETLVNTLKDFLERYFPSVEMKTNIKKYKTAESGCKGLLSEYEDGSI